MTGRALAAAAALLLLFVAPVQAQDEEEDDTFYRTHFYAGLGGAFLLENAGNDLARQSGLSSIGNAGALNGRAGIRFAKYASFELQGEGFWGFSDNNGMIFTANVKIYGLTGRLQPFAVGGAGLMTYFPKNSALDAQTGGGFRAGLGVDYNFTEHIGIEVLAEYVLGTGQAQDLQYAAFGAGLLYNF